VRVSIKIGKINTLCYARLVNRKAAKIGKLPLGIGSLRTCSMWKRKEYLYVWMGAESSERILIILS